MNPKARRLLKALVPLRIREGIRATQTRLLGVDHQFRGLATQDVFDKVYAEGLWGRNEAGESISGSGSHDAQIVSPYVQEVSSLIRRLDCAALVDLGCGDFNVGRHFVDLCRSYVACDISKLILERNFQRYRHAHLSFRHLNLAEDPLPPGDIAFVRQVLQHLSNAEISAFVDRLNRTRPYRFLLVTEHHPVIRDFVPNRDKPCGPGIRVGLGSGVVLDRHPFKLAHASRQVVAEVGERIGGRDALIRSTLYAF